MTRIQEAEVTCPICSTRQTTKIWNSLNVSIDPDAKEKLLKGEINRFECHQCGEKAYMDVPFMYHDMENQLVVQFFPPSALQDPQFFQQFTPDGKLKVDFGVSLPESLMQESRYFSEPHIVFSMQELVLYVLFRDKLKAV